MVQDSGNITNKHSPLIMGAILAHELTHHFLDSKGIRLSDEEENEKLTDLATSYIGLGKLTVNGYDPISWTQRKKNGSVTWNYRVGYLSSEDMAAVIHQTCLFRNISLSFTKVNLSENSQILLDGIQKKAQEYNLKKKLVGVQQCPHCDQYVSFSFSKQDDGLYCSRCNWEYIDGLRYRNNRWRKLLRRIFKRT
ncbi:MAG: M13 family metallopeptidase [Desulfobacterium sp.]|nr:M13 family metallopeptidase [Desulfobacterium sp.]